MLQSLLFFSSLFHRDTKYRRGKYENIPMFVLSLIKYRFITNFTTIVVKYLATIRSKFIHMCEQQVADETCEQIFYTLHFQISNGMI